MKYAVVLYSLVWSPPARYVESEHRWKWQAERAMRRHRLYGKMTWRLIVESVTPVTSSAEPAK